MRLAVISHKTCWRSDASPTGFASDGGFPMQLEAVASLFSATSVVVPVDLPANRRGEVPVSGNGMAVVPLRPLGGRGIGRKLQLPLWLLREGARIARVVRDADAIYAPIPGDVGTIGIIMSLLFRRRLLVRYCGNWRRPRTAAERLWIALLERIAGDSTVVLATGGDEQPPSKQNPAIGWIFATSLGRAEIERLGKPRKLPVERAPRIAIACRQDERKGTDVVIRALARLQSRIPGVELHVAGEGPALPDCRALARSHGLDDKVTFHGKLDHEGVIRLLQRCDLFCFPTRASEGFPKAVLEAMACGLPVVTTAVAALPLLVGTDAGVVVAAANPQPVADAMERILLCGRTYANMSEAALRKARRYSMEAWAATIEQRLATAWGPLRATA